MHWLKTLTCEHGTVFGFSDGRGNAVGKETALNQSLFFKMYLELIEVVMRNMIS